ncbi:glycosyltransferase family 4 protein [Achromobacter sp. D10]|uniref:glycosyltransferase family 4 protein n=1 Tax=Achromobacter TaxID=222 RepID=UPI001EEEADF1|nr:glycosyltransferase family 4 protein [Achromobacter sp. D10]MEB3094564.1 glycosyltransferase family 4 protein [Achromobacter sp. D10]
MKIVHFCVSCFYIDGYRYQENELIREHVKAGHEVTVVASTETFVNNMDLGYTEPGTYVGAEGAKVIRLPYSGPFPSAVRRKLRVHPGIDHILEEIKPDAIMFHGLCGWELLTVARYVKRHPGVIFYADSHEDANNSATNFISKHLLHGQYYRRIIQACLPYIAKVLCISLETMEFCHAQYGIPREKLEFFPLGGNVLDDAAYADVRQRTREKYGFADDEVVFLQSGKIDAKKKLADSLRAFARTSDPKLKFVVAGAISETVAPEINPLMAADSRVSFLGWKTSEELHELLCAADVYVQPGSQSASMQAALCCRRPVIVDDVLSHQPFVAGNGWLVRNGADLQEVFLAIEADKSQLEAMSQGSFEVARRLLDYSQMARRILQ